MNEVFYFIGWSEPLKSVDILPSPAVRLAYRGVPPQMHFFAENLTIREARDTAFALVKIYQPPDNMTPCGGRGRKRWVECLADGKIYPSATEAAEAYGVTLSTVSNSARGVSGYGNRFAFWNPS